MERRSFGKVRLNENVSREYYGLLALRQMVKQDLTAKVCIGCGSGRLLSICLKCQKTFKQHEGEYCTCGEKLA